MKSRLLNLLKLVISAGLLVVTFRAVDWRQTRASLASIDWGLFALAGALFQMTLLIRSYRWRALLLALESRVPVARLIYWYYVGTFFNTFLPSGFGGDAVKMYELGRYSHSASDAIGTVLVDRLAGIVVLFLMGLAVWPWASTALPRSEAIFLLAVSVVGLTMTWLLFQRALVIRVLAIAPTKVRGKVEQLYLAIHACGTRALLHALGISVAFNIVLFAVTYLLARALGQHIPLLYFVSFMPLISLSMLIPSVGALGTRESAYVLLFGAAGTPTHIAAAMSLAFYLVNVVTGIIGAVLYIVDATKGLGATHVSHTAM